MIVVSNTSPLNYLILIESVRILPALFDRVVVPQSVARELAHERAPELVRSWIASPPSWLEVLAPQAPEPTIALDAGERDALCLALELQADMVLIDDRAARRVARERGLRVVGMLGVMELAAVRGLIDLPQAVEALRRTTYRIRADVLQSLLDEYSRRQTPSTDQHD